MKEPKIRFKGFQGEWEETTFDKSVTINSGMDYKHLAVGNIPVYGTGGYMLSVNESLSEVDAIGIGRKGTIDKPQLLKAPFWTVDTLFFMTPKNSNDLNFLYALSQKINWRNYDESTGVPSLSKLNIGKIEFARPDRNEQRAIASYFQHLDSLIQSTTKNIESLKQVKAASLQSMFPQEGETTPRVRFKGFEGEWEKVSIKECLEEINEKNFPIQTDFVLSLTIKDGVLPYSEKGNIGNRAKEDHSLYKLAYPNTIVLNSMNILIGAIGVCNYFGCVSPVYYVLKETEQADLWFMYYIMSDRKFQIELNQIATGMMEIRKKVPMDELMEKAILVPNKEEQHKIADYFTSLDRQITLHTQRLEKLKQIKSACLDNMFV